MDSLLNGFCPSGSEKDGIAYKPWGNSARSYSYVENSLQAVSVLVMYQNTPDYVRVRENCDHLHLNYSEFDFNGNKIVLI